VAANEELRNAGCVGRLEEMLALSSVGGQVDVKKRYPRIGVRASERIVGHSYKAQIDPAAPSDFAIGRKRRSRRDRIETT
jgi:hypothetical protein